MQYGFFLPQKRSETQNLLSIAFRRASARLVPILTVPRYENFDVFVRFPASPWALRHMAEPGHHAGHVLHRARPLRARRARPARQCEADRAVGANEALKVMDARGCWDPSSSLMNGSPSPAHSAHTHECAGEGDLLPIQELGSQQPRPSNALVRKRKAVGGEGGRARGMAARPRKAPA